MAKRHAKRMQHSDGLLVKRKNNGRKKLFIKTII